MFTEFASKFLKYFIFVCNFSLTLNETSVSSKRNISVYYVDHISFLKKILLCLEYGDIYAYTELKKNGNFESMYFFVFWAININY